ncbi:serine/threonine protein kinase (plasmid) [Staphylococcus simulans]|uniref:class III lanthionine synthetase LanKC n=1 Tax=Staphylococcus simulans TaxID=1286 RepID=UPI000D09FDAB|nr:class III lanthionine synthetase LanKC [Staphylococcus simulans]AVO03434.1 serine/threonine protein kinase [Staphylococcus simulans]AVO06303.1 serine/threonine protein kinase [Staphylococcus simulans]AWG19983.1 serine/threonine protein kinase [Staphylococcus simulans]AWI02867.1 serine/threonine protein kinase [Staphylococcus simulans]
MDIRYLNYLGNGSSYYSVPETVEEDYFEIKDIPENYQFIDGDHWINMINDNLEDFPKQGWKIHISSDVINAEDTLRIVALIMFSKNISFKYVKSMFELKMKNSKYGDRASSGKFITIYPKTEDEFISLLFTLENKLDSTINAPYILNDKRWKNTNIYFRYGGFIDIPLYIDGRKTSGIITPDGEVIEDKRLPYYSLPYFVEEPKIIKEMNLIEEDSKESRLDNYDIQEAIHFSNGGGVYLALDTLLDKKVIIKEGRPGAGLDASSRDAFTRIKNEKYILKKLQNTKKVVDVLDYFDEWEHTFIVEEYLEGMDLYDWIARNYPFYKSAPTEIYINDCLYILKQLRKVIQDIHHNNVGMGDLQPSNIIIDDSKNITLIDFETASTPYDEIHGGLMTVGFAGDLTMNRIQSDWFALLRIAKQLFLPIGPVADISENMDEVHNSWIKNVFGEKAINIIKEIQKTCNSLGTKPLPEKFHSNGEFKNTFNIKSTKEKIRNGLVESLKDEHILVPGDIRQYEMTGGEINVLTGGFGVAMSLNRTGGINNTVNDWIDKLPFEKLANLDNGLFTGKAGVVSVLLELGKYKKARKLVTTIKNYKNSVDVSLASGLSGIGLSFLDMYIESNDIEFLEKTKEIGDILEVRLNQNVDIVVFDEDIANKGLICGWSGVSLFYSALYNITSEDKWLDLSLKAIEKDLDLSTFDEYNSFHIDDSFRLMPYLCGGSAGVILALIEYQSITTQNLWEKEVNAFLVNSTSKTFYNCGLFRGTSGIIATTNLIENYYKKVNKSKTIQSLSTLNIHLIETNDYIYCPGDGCYRLSGDLFSGSSGVILTLNEILEGKNMTWLPVTNLNKMFASYEVNKI